LEVQDHEGVVIVYAVFLRRYVKVPERSRKVPERCRKVPLELQRYMNVRVQQGPRIVFSKRGYDRLGVRRVFGPCVNR
jgi:hypothetical protein